jgi:hypothetical protein
MDALIKTHPGTDSFENKGLRQLGNKLPEWAKPLFRSTSVPVGNPVALSIFVICSRALDDGKAAAPQSLTATNAIEPVSLKRLSA